MEKAYSALTIKAVNNEQRIIKGIASTITPDRAKDIVEPNGIMYELPFPFLWQHEHSKPIGQVINAKTTPRGLEIEVQIAKIEEPGTLKDQVDYAWGAIKSGLVRGMSIGFRPLDAEYLSGGGVHYKAIELFEVSAVTIPANSEATITNVKHAAKRKKHTTVKLSSPAKAVQLSPVVELNVVGELTHSEKLLAAQLAYADPATRKSMLDPFMQEFGADRGRKVLLMADGLKGDL